MVNVSQVNAQRLDLLIEGAIDSGSMERVLDEFIAAAETMEQGRMLYDFVDVHFPSLSAVGMKLSRLPTLLRLLRKFDRIAVVTDTPWIKVASEIEGALWPGLEIKGFRRDQKAEAEAWLAG